MSTKEIVDSPSRPARSGGERSRAGSNYGDWSPNRPRRPASGEGVSRDDRDRRGADTPPDGVRAKNVDLGARPPLLVDPLVQGSPGPAPDGISKPRRRPAQREGADLDNEVSD